MRDFKAITVRAGIGGMLLASVATGAFASSHREAPGITKTPKIDGTDFYMFRSYESGRSDFVTFIANYQPIQAPYGGPNYFTMDPDAIYEIHVDNDGDAIEDITFRFDFDNVLAQNGNGIALPVGGEDSAQNVAVPLRQIGPISGMNDGTQNEFERFTLTRIDGDRLSGTQAAITTGGQTVFSKPIDNIGTKTLPNYGDYAAKFIYPVDIPGCDTQGRVFVGQRAEAFAVNLGPIFDLVNFVPVEGAIEQNREENDDLVGKANVTSLAIEVPISCVVENADSPVIGAWTTSSLPQAQVEDPSPTYGATSVYGGAYVQQSRLSAPLVNELVIGLPDKDLFNASEPMDDGDFATYVTNPTLPELLEILFAGAGVQAPNNFPRNDLVAAFLTGFPGVNQQSTVTASEMMRLNTSVAATPRADQQPLGVAAGDLAGFPNGRRPGDDVVDIALRVVMGALCYDLPVGENGAGANLGYCTPDDAPSGNVPFTDGAPLNARDIGNTFPYLNTPLPGAQ